MVKKFLGIVLMLAAGLLSVAAESPAPVSSTASTAADPHAQEIKKAKALVKKSEYVKAKKIYAKLLKDETLSAGRREKVRGEMEKLNVKALLSPLETPGSVVYTVKPGDSLYTIAKKHNTSIELIQKANQLKDDRIHPDQKLKVVNGKFSIEVDKSKNLLKLLLDGKVIKRYAVATGVDDSTPVGEFHIINKLKDPTWYKVGTGAIAADSPENHLGTRWMGFDKKGYGIHGTVDPKSIGQSVSSGCIRMHNEDVEELYVLVPQGTTVRIA